MSPNRSLRDREWAIIRDRNITKNVEKIPKWTAWPKFTRVEPLFRQTGCVSRRHHTSVQGWGSTSHPQTTPVVLWWPPWSAASSSAMMSTYATSRGVHRWWSGVDQGWTQVRLFISVFFSTFLLIFRSLIKVRSQNKDDPTAYGIRHDISQNQRSELLTCLSMLKTMTFIPASGDRACLKG